MTEPLLQRPRYSTVVPSLFLREFLIRGYRFAASVDKRNYESFKDI